MLPAACHWLAPEMNSTGFGWISGRKERTDDELAAACRVLVAVCASPTPVEKRPRYNRPLAATYVDRIERMSAEEAASLTPGGRNYLLSILHDFEDANAVMIALRKKGMITVGDVVNVTDDKYGCYTDEDGPETSHYLRAAVVEALAAEGAAAAATAGKRLAAADPTLMASVVFLRDAVRIVKNEFDLAAASFTGGVVYPVGTDTLEDSLRWLVAERGGLPDGDMGAVVDDTPGLRIARRIMTPSKEWWDPIDFAEGELRNVGYKSIKSAWAVHLAFRATDYLKEVIQTGAKEDGLPAVILFVMFAYRCADCTYKVPRVPRRLFC